MAAKLDWTFAPAPEDKLEESESNFYNALLPALEKKCYIFYNHEKQGKGFAATFSLDTSLAKFVSHSNELGRHSLFSDRFFGDVAVVPVNESDFETPEFAHASSIKSRLRHVESEGLVKVWTSNTGKEDERWADVVLSAQSLASVDWHAGISSKSGHFVGVHATKKKKEKAILLEEELKSSFEPPKYYISAHSDSGPVGRALNRHLLKMALEGATIGNFVNSREYKMASKFSDINIQRLLAAVGDVIGINRELLSIVPDLNNTIASPENPHRAPPDVCTSERTVHTTYNTIVVQDHNKNSAVYYNQCAQLKEGARIAILRNPRAGLYLLETAQDYDYVNRRKKSTNSSSSLLEPNGLAAIPIGLGKNKRAMEFSQMEPMALHKKLEGNVEEETFFWSGQKKEHKFANWRLIGYKEDTEEMRSKLRHIIGPETYVHALKPVALYISHK